LHTDLHTTALLRVARLFSRPQCCLINRSRLLFVVTQKPDLAFLEKASGRRGQNCTFSSRKYRHYRPATKQPFKTASLHFARYWPASSRSCLAAGRHTIQVSKRARLQHSQVSPLHTRHLRCSETFYKKILSSAGLGFPLLSLSAVCSVGTVLMKRGETGGSPDGLSLRVAALVSG